ncbi:hypothetical protein IAD21_04376 [Abditibacteriota bacterium]|nr:hypothetical protein IAD21_04376 [Abditibacteriota bacterium]
MSELTFWMPWIVAFLFAFALASLVSGFAYWLARHPSEVVRVVKEASSALALCALFYLLLVALANHFLGHALFFVTVTIGASGLQALIERSLIGELLALKLHFVRSFLTYVCTASLLFALVRVLADSMRFFIPSPTSIPLEVMQLSNWLSHLTMGSSAPNWMVFLSTAFCGLFAGWLVAPLSISFYRFLFQSIQLRPGVDRPLCDKELTQLTTQAHEEKETPAR